MTRIDYEHDSLAEIVLKQMEAIQELEHRDMASERFTEAVSLVGFFLADLMAHGHSAVTSITVIQLLRDAALYAKDGSREPPWMEDFEAIRVKRQNKGLDE
jgi:hypothetical protein